MGKNSIYDIANWFLNKEKMTPKKLQKIVYYAYAWFLTLMNDDSEHLDSKLFNGEFQAWVHGPVNYNLYKKYKQYGYNQISHVEPVVIDNPDVIDVLEQVWDVYGEYNANQLESITHQEEPWIKARGECSPYDACDTVISDKDMYNYYGERLD